MMTLWAGFKQLHSTSDDKIGSNEEDFLVESDQNNEKVGIRSFPV